MEKILECPPEVGVEDMIDDRVKHRTAVGEPLEAEEKPWGEVGQTALAAGPLDDVDSKEREVAGNEHGEQNPEHLQNTMKNADLTQFVCIQHIENIIKQANKKRMSQNDPTSWAGYINVTA